MNEDRKLFNERIEMLRHLDPNSDVYNRIYILASITSAIYNWGVIDTMIKAEVVS